MDIGTSRGEISLNKTVWEYPNKCSYLLNNNYI